MADKANRVHPFQTDFPHPPPATTASHSQRPKSFPEKQPTLSSRSIPGFYRPRRRCYNPCCCCCCAGWICSALISIVIFLGVIALLLYLVLRPKVPKFSVTDVHISEFNLTSKPLGQPTANATAPAYLQTDVNFTIEAENPNKKIGFYGDSISVALYYEGLQIGNGSVPALYLGYRDTKQLQLEMKGQDTPLTQDIDSGLQTAVTTGSSIGLQVMTVTETRIKVWWWKSRNFRLRVKCDVEISSPIADRSTQLLSKSCKLKVLDAWL